MSAEPFTQESSARHALRFEGSADEYLKIWIVNLALSIVTLGVFSAWAKVRSKRYFYGNTFIGTHAFDYHAQPLRILVGRAIAAALLLAYVLADLLQRLEQVTCSKGGCLPSWLGSHPATEARVLRLRHGMTH
jgi:uncharacterized membrane protein YjgN (DUF898 family)